MYPGNQFSLQMIFSSFLLLTIQFYASVQTIEYNGNNPGNVVPKTFTTPLPSITNVMCLKFSCNYIKPKRPADAQNISFPTRMEMSSKVFVFVKRNAFQRMENARAL